MGDAKLCPYRNSGGGAILPVRYWTLLWKALVMHRIAKTILRTDRLPFLFCPGCGDGVIVQAVARAIEDIGMIDRLCMVGGIGCSSWIVSYFNVDFMKVLHGRALPAATGLKLADPSRKVIVVSGDGDCVGIGGNHLIHAARRNIDLTVIMVNNQIYGMTGGQVAPTTPAGARTTTTPYGNLEPPIDACELVRASGATFISRWTTAHPKQLSDAVKKAIGHPGFAFVEVISQCPTQSGRYIHGTDNPVELVEWIKETYLTRSKIETLSPEEKAQKIPIGDFVEDTKPEFTAMVYQLMERNV